jgi:hypothetical protein
MAFPKIIEALAQSGYTARSGNRARIVVAAMKAGASKRRGFLEIHWAISPSPADLAELNQILSSQVTIQSATDGADPAALDKIRAFLEGP